MKKLLFQRQINVTLKKILEIETNWKKVVNIENFINISKVNSNDDDYYLIYDSKKLTKILKNTTLQSIVITKSFNFNENDIVIKRSRIFYLSMMYLKQMIFSKENYEWNNELKAKFKNLINRLNNLRTFRIEIDNFFTKILDNNVSIKREILILNTNHESFNWTNCFDDNCIIHCKKKLKKIDFQK